MKIETATILAVNKGRFFAVVDEIDLVHLAQRAWTMAAGYPSTRIGGKLVYLHRYVTKALPHEEVDHVNGNKLDSRRSNLRRGSRSENTHNRKLNRSNNTGFKGVQFYPRARDGKRWRARISIDGKKIHLGGFPTAEEAARAFDDAARRGLGEVARYNFPQQGERSAR